MARVYLRHFHDHSINDTVEVGTPTPSEHEAWMKGARAELAGCPDAFLIDDSEVTALFAVDHPSDIQV